MTTQTSTMINACDASIWMGNHAGVYKEISGSSNEVNMKFDNEVGESKNFRSSWKKRLVCGADAEFSLVITYSTAADEAFELLRDWFFTYRQDKRLFKIYLPDKNVGADEYSGSFVLKDLAIPAKADDANPIMVTATLLPDGEVVLATNAT